MILNKIVVFFFLFVAFSFKPNDNPAFRKYIKRFGTINNSITFSYNCPLDSVFKKQNNHFDTLLFGPNEIPIFIVNEKTETVSFLVYENNRISLHNKLSIKTFDFTATLIESNDVGPETNDYVNWLKVDTSIYMEHQRCPLTSKISFLYNNTLAREDFATNIVESYNNDGMSYITILTGVLNQDTFNIFPFKKIK
jgi:hypothetical protein